LKKIVNGSTPRKALNVVKKTFELFEEEEEEEEEDEDES
jgi:hypothetical protein